MNGDGNERSEEEKFLSVILREKIYVYCEYTEEIADLDFVNVRMRTLLEDIFIIELLKKEGIANIGCMHTIVASDSGIDSGEIVAIVEPPTEIRLTSSLVCSEGGIGKEASTSAIMNGTDQSRLSTSTTF